MEGKDVSLKTTMQNPVTANKECSSWMTMCTTYFLLKV